MPPFGDDLPLSVLGGDVLGAARGPHSEEGDTGRMPEVQPILPMGFQFRPTKLVGRFPAKILPPREVAQGPNAPKNMLRVRFFSDARISTSFTGTRCSMRNWTEIGGVFTRFATICWLSDFLPSCSTSTDTLAVPCARAGLTRKRARSSGAQASHRRRLFAPHGQDFAPAGTSEKRFDAGRGQEPLDLAIRDGRVWKLFLDIRRAARRG